MRAVLVKAIADLRRRRLQAAVIFLTALLAVATGTMALTLMSQTRDPYEQAFAAQKGAHLQVGYTVTDPKPLENTPQLIGAAVAGGPYLSASVQYEFGSQKVYMLTMGRDNPGGDIEQLRITSGRWPTNTSEVALTRSFAELNHISVGQQLKVVSVPAEPLLTVAAEVVDIDEGTADLSSQHAWVLSSAISALATKSDLFYWMTYRFAGDPTDAQLQAAVNEIRAALPPGTVGGSVNYLLIRSVFNITNQIITSVLIAFSSFAILATAAIVANLVTGIVISSYRDIGIMKAIGFSPSDVSAVLLLQVLIPTGVACVVGIPLGTLGSQPLLANSAQALGLAYQPTFSPWLDVAALVGALAVVALAASIPAVRAALLKPAVVIAKATAPVGRSGRVLRALASAMRLPRPVALGMGDALARPVRTILTILAIFVGVVTVMVAMGLPRSFTAINDSETNAGHVDVQITRSPALPDSAVMNILQAQPQTDYVVAEQGLNMIVPGIGDAVNARVFRGDATKLGYLVVAGRWFSSAGEAVAPRALMGSAHLKVGDRFTVSVSGKAVPLVLVGEVYDISNLGQTLFTDWSTVASVLPDFQPFNYRIKLTPGADVDAYVRNVAAAQPDLLEVRKNDTSLIGPVKIIDNVLFAIAAVIALIGIAGIFNTLLLNTRERVRDTATLKAVGMSPRQVMVMVAAAAGLLALIGGLIALPAGVVLNRFLLDLISGSAGNDTPPSTYGVFASWELIAIPVVTLLVAMAAALVPGRWAARTNVIEVLHAE
ncbi:MAG TPA: FtsX-like permease family protein [Candidatus Dormibacteraeota bacterium]|nr:FtsX-like permease family protein [Candidatus Dormibacteraeota bacterium]